jgi:hypothetical protein
VRLCRRDERAFSASADATDDSVCWDVRFFHAFLWLQSWSGLGFDRIIFHWLHTTAVVCLLIVAENLTSGLCLLLA